MAYSENMKKVEKTVANQSKVSYIFSSSRVSLESE